MPLKSLTIVPMGPMKGPPMKKGKAPAEDDDAPDYGEGDDDIKSAWAELGDALHVDPAESDDVCDKLVSFIKLVSLKADEDDPHEEAADEEPEE